MIQAHTYTVYTIGNKKLNLNINYLSTKNFDKTVVAGLQTLHYSNNYNILPETIHLIFTISQ